MRNNKIKYILLFGVLLSMLSVFYSCWYYSFSGKSLPGIESIAVPLFTDIKGEIQVRDKLQSMLISTFQDENILKVVGQNQADAVLNGVIEDIRDDPTALDRQEQARQWELRIVVQVKLENRKTGKVILTERITGLGFYKELPERDEAIDQALKQLARDISNKIVSGW